MKKVIIIMLLLPMLTVVGHADYLLETAAEMSGASAVEDNLSESEKMVSGDLTMDGSYDIKSEY